ncbi:MAG TPA: glycoside hydrolase family 15 protein [Polyangiaceae bacterium]|nr:glycoside hydrolase family 15 protein [Polyangiaceae bacterium]
MRIEDYALIGDTRTAALVAKNGSMDWLCVPRFDQAACFAALLGSAEHGRWLLSPQDSDARVSRRYLEDTLVLETTHETASGAVRVLDFMPLGKHPLVARIVEGLRGSVTMRCELVIRFDYGKTIPWVRQVNGNLTAIAGPDALELQTPIALSGEGMKSVATFELHAGERIPFRLRWFPSHEEPEPLPELEQSLRATEQFWRDWVAQGHDEDPYRAQIVRSLITLKALTFSPTGGMVAAPTSSLPEALGGSRNWDYRFCWLRDSTFTLYALLHGGYRDEARAFRDWLLRAVAGDPGKVQICYGVSGERRLPELELEWLPGYENSRPVRIGNAASEQMQLDIYGEVGDTLHQARRYGIDSDALGWPFQLAHTEWLSEAWREPDQGLWEKRGKPQHFTHSKVLTWVAFDRAIKAVEKFGLSGPVEHWRRVRAEIRESILTHGFDRGKNSFTRAYGSNALDASLLLIPAVGFLPANDPRVLGTILAIERELLQAGFVRRYTPEQDHSGEGTEGAFIACSFWLVDAYVLSGQKEKAKALFERLLTLQNDVGLLAEEYDVTRGRFVGNFPQSFSHVALVNSARNLGERTRPSERRRST